MAISTLSVLENKSDNQIVLFHWFYFLTDMWNFRAKLSLLLSWKIALGLKAGSNFAAGRTKSRMSELAWLVQTLPQAACRGPQAASRTSWTYFNFLCISTNSATEFSAISRAFCVCRNINCDCAYAHIKNHVACALQFACCGLCCGLRQSMPQAAASKLQCAGHIVFHVCVPARAGARFGGALRQNIFKITALEKIVANLIYMQIK